MKSHLASQGIDPRSSRAVVVRPTCSRWNNDAPALALNRRTEFVFYGLLIE